MDEKEFHDHLKSFLHSQAIKCGPKSSILKMSKEISDVCKEMKSAPEDFFRVDPFQNENPVWDRAGEIFKEIRYIL